MRTDLLRISTGRDAADYVQPILLREINKRRGAVDKILIRDGNPKRGGIREPVAEKRRRRNSHHGERLAVERKIPADYGRVAGERLLPGAVADHRDWRCAFAIVIRHQHSSRVRPDSEHGEIISRDELAPHGLRGLAAAAAAHSNEVMSRLKRGEFDETGRVIAESLIFVVGEERPVVLQAAVDAAILLVAHAIEFAGFGHRQGIQQHGMHQRKNGCGCANSER